MDHDGDKGGKGEGPRIECAGDRWTLFMGWALKTVIALIAVGAAAASVPYWERADFPVTSLVIYVAGMVFIAMPLCLYYEALLRTRQDHATQA
ncbi:hypothetical protein [Variovorax soli]|uniref:Solute:sodium symporter small subunit n=1 Tax=Variovorax soli TaxID=376815 RepID=A0ABU1N8L9_9BURK|nr:hypothetical protein [Variovorax soli]MDR6534786.1 hypothetical protein [Variovorax soli]